MNKTQHLKRTASFIVLFVFSFFIVSSKDFQIKPKVAEEHQKKRDVNPPVFNFSIYKKHFETLGTVSNVSLNNCPNSNVTFFDSVTLITSAPKSFFKVEKLSGFPNVFDEYSLRHMNAKLHIYSEDDLSDLIRSPDQTCQVNPIHLKHIMRKKQIKYIEANSFSLGDYLRSRNLFYKVLAISEELRRSKIDDIVVWLDTDVLMENIIDQNFVGWVRDHDVSSIAYCKPDHIEKDCMELISYNKSKLLDTCACAFETGIMAFKVSATTRSLAQEVLDWYHPSVNASRIASEKKYFGLHVKELGPIFDIQNTRNDVAVWSHVVLKYWLRGNISVGYFAGELDSYSANNGKVWSQHAGLYKDAGRNFLVTAKSGSDLVSPFNIFSFFMHFRGLSEGLANQAMQRGEVLQQKRTPPPKI